MAEMTVVEGDLLAQEVEAIVNAWNRNVIPWWLLLPQGVSGAIKRLCRVRCCIGGRAGAQSSQGEERARREP